MLSVCVGVGICCFILWLVGTFFVFSAAHKYGCVHENYVCLHPLLHCVVRLAFCVLCVAHHRVCSLNIDEGAQYRVIHAQGFDMGGVVVVIHVVDLGPLTLSRTPTRTHTCPYRDYAEWVVEAGAA